VIGERVRVTAGNEFVRIHPGGREVAVDPPPYGVKLGL
jgi:hypothetical protein